MNRYLAPCCWPPPPLFPRPALAADAYPSARPVNLIVPFRPAALPTRWRAGWRKSSGSR